MVIPSIYISDLKWQFLHNGAFKCITEVYTPEGHTYSFYSSDWILIQCANTPVGRYISMIFPMLQDELRDEKMSMISDSSVQLIHTTEGTLSQLSKKKNQRKIAINVLSISLTCVLGVQNNLLIETVILSTHNICFG